MKHVECEEQWDKEFCFAAGPNPALILDIPEVVEDPDNWCISPAMETSTVRYIPLYYHDIYLCIAVKKSS